MAFGLAHVAGACGDDDDAKGDAGTIAQGDTADSGSKSPAPPANPASKDAGSSDEAEDADVPMDAGNAATDTSQPGSNAGAAAPAPAPVMDAGAAMDAASPDVPDAATPTTTVGDYRMRTLANGLTVYSARDPNTANVTVQVYYKVGSKDDPAGRSGFAHLFEHLMFKATRNLPNEALDRLTEDVGGYDNAYTASDTTAYYEVVPANYLEGVLFAEADRLSSLVVDQANFESERSVVEEELRQSVLADPYGRLFSLYLPQEAFQEHPYRRPTIGSIADLEAASLENVRAFHSTFYRPDNAYLIVIGGFDEPQLDAWVDKYFSPIARPKQALPTNDVQEPQRTAARSVSYYAPNVPLPAVVVNWLTTRVADDDTPALTILDAILSSGSSSRLYQSLVYDQKLVADTGSILDQSKQAGMLSLYAIMADGKAVADGEAALSAEAAKLRDSLVSAAELDQAKHEIVAARLREREDVIGRGEALGTTLIMTGDAANVAREVEQLQKVSADDVQRVARKYLGDASRLTINYLSEADKPANTPSEPRQPASDAPIKLEDLAPAGPAIEPASDADRAKVPAPGPERAIPTPVISERRLPSGLRVLVAPQHDVALVSAQLSFVAGATADPDGKDGVASMTARLASDGTTGKTAPELASAIEDLGAELSAGASYDFTSLYANSPTDVFERAAGLLAEMARQPAFLQAELTREKQQLLDDLTVANGDPGDVASSLVGRLVFGAAGYGAQVSGTAQSIARITRTDIVNFHNTRWRPETATLIFSGDIEPDAAFALADRLFGDWRGPTAPVPTIPAAVGPVVPPRAIAVDLPMSGQAAVLATTRAIARNDPAYYPLLVANAVLGGGYSARLNKEIRIERGLSYGAGSSFAARLRAGVIVASAQTRNDAAVEVARLMLGEVGRLSSELVSVDELTARRAGLLGDFARALETVDGAAESIADFALYDLPQSELNDYASKVRAVTPEQLRDAATSNFALDTTNLIVTGDAQMFSAQLRTDHPDLELIPVDQLNLDNVSLR